MKKQKSFYREVATGGRKVRVGMEASGQARWFERLLGELNIELWIGDAAEIRAKRVRKKKTNREDARLILRLLLEDRFPQRSFRALLAFASTQYVRCLRYPEPRKSRHR